MNDETQTETKPPREPGRARRIASITFLIIATVLAPLSIVVTWTRAELLRTDRYVSTVAPLANNTAILDYTADQLTNKLFAEVDVAGRLKSALPPAAAFIIGPLDTTLQGFVHDKVREFLGTEQFRKIWVAANRLAHEHLRELLKGDNAIADSEGRVIVDLTPLVARARAALDDHGITVFDNVSLDKIPLKFEIFKLKVLYQARSAVHVLDIVGIALPFLTLGFAGAAVWLARDRRRRLIAVALSIAGSVAVLGIAFGIARIFYLNAATSATLPRAVARASYDIALHRLRLVVRITLAVALMVVAGAIFAGPSDTATAARARVRKWFKRPEPGEAEPGRLALWVGAHRAIARALAVGAGFVVLLFVDTPSLGLVLG
jgi:hypothetical protein